MTGQAVQNKKIAGMSVPAFFIGSTAKTEFGFRENLLIKRQLMPIAVNRRTQAEQTVLALHLLHRISYRRRKQVHGHPRS